MTFGDSMDNAVNPNWFIKFKENVLSDNEIMFIHEALVKSGLEYTENGFDTLKTWELLATIKEDEKNYYITISPITARVNAEWQLQIDKNTGTTEQTWSATLDV